MGDYYKKEELAKDRDFKGFKPEEDPGVVSVTEIFNYYKKHGYNTIVMGASFRNVDEILQLTGCDRLTISPGLIEKLKEEGTVEKHLDATKSIEMDIPKIDVDEKKFRMMMCMNRWRPKNLPRESAGSRPTSKSLRKSSPKKSRKPARRRNKQHKYSSTVVVWKTGGITANIPRGKKRNAQRLREGDARTRTHHESFVVCQ